MYGVLNALRALGMDGWVIGWVDGRMDEWVDGCTIPMKSMSTPKNFPRESCAKQIMTN